ncbi:SGNH/GDSL hydrolase family protein [Longimicrobium sp.]|uniref:SGNH/GDSL hydrolase family protein n=1 Tax=Longimicrobium sp. TaxID=2029185 RepID=UPI002E30C139|nr:SGNH/GDSL hydrolase family protein [Longimicrobium sp.]HEX6039989.1 SGNH/GDSL hydrolase family protein [Longimicrobium sp.]
MKKRSLGKALRVAALAGVALLGACVGDGDEVITTVTPAGAGGTLFTRYVSLGNSITAGYQSSGINDSLQVRAYPVLLAQRAAANFNAPLIARPGCPRPFLAPLGTTGRVGGTAADTCVRINSPVLVNNLAVPGERLGDLLQFPTGQLASLNTLLIGPRTQVRAMIEAHPTFVSVWIGNNDALEASLGGVLGPRAAGADSTLTTLAAFTTRLNALVDSIKVAAPQGAMLIGVVNAIQAAPLIQPGAYFWLARDAATDRFNGKPVNANCSPVNNLGQPNPLSANMVSFQILSDTNFPEINCDPAAYPVGDPRRGAYVLDTAEQAIVTARVNAYNSAIQAAATANNWLYVNPNTIFGEFAGQQDDNGRYQRVRKCQALAGALASGSAAAVQGAVLTSCPVPPTGPTAPYAAPNFFGTLISFDGVHPSTEAHVILAGRFAAAINQKYGTTLSTAIN